MRRRLYVCLLSGMGQCRLSTAVKMGRKAAHSRHMPQKSSPIADLIATASVFRSGALNGMSKEHHVQSWWWSPTPRSGAVAGAHLSWLTLGKHLQRARDCGRRPVLALQHGTCAEGDGEGGPCGSSRSKGGSKGLKGLPQLRPTAAVLSGAGAAAECHMLLSSMHDGPSSHSPN